MSLKIKSILNQLRNKSNDLEKAKHPWHHRTHAKFENFADPALSTIDDEGSRAMSGRGTYFSDAEDPGDSESNSEYGPNLHRRYIDPKDTLDFRNLSRDEIGKLVQDHKENYIDQLHDDDPLKEDLLSVHENVKNAFDSNPLTGEPKKDHKNFMNSFGYVFEGDDHYASSLANRNGKKGYITSFGELVVTDPDFVNNRDSKTPIETPQDYKPGEVNFLKHLSKSEPEPVQTPLEIIDLGNGYTLVHTHSQAPDVSDRAQSMGAVDYYEIKHPASEHVLASLTGMAGEDTGAIIKIGVILPEHKAVGVATSVFEALKRKYGKCPDDVLSYLKTAWGDQDENPSIPSNPSNKKHDKIDDVLGFFFQKKKRPNDLKKSQNKMDSLFKSLRKSNLQKSMMIKVLGHKGWHELQDINDSGVPAHLPGGGNHYTFKHAKTGETHTVHQSEVEDMADSEELTKVMYFRKFGNKHLSKNSKDPRTTYDLGDGYSLVHSADGIATQTPKNHWDIMHESGDQAGHIEITHGSSGVEGSHPAVTMSHIFKQHRGQGLGRRAYKKLVEHYGSLTSDEERTPEAKAAWRSIGGKFKKRPGQSSNRFGRYYKESGTDPVKWVEDVAKADTISGGMADKKTPSDFNKKKLSAGKKVEMEHTSSPKIATEIAMDHLTEDPDYYDKLDFMESSKFDAIFSTLSPMKKFAAGVAGISGPDATGAVALSKSSKERESKLRTLAGETQSGIDPLTGQRALLLFRGMEADEFEETVEPNIKVSNQNHSTWTPFPDIAMQFSPTGYLVGAWISEDNMIVQRNTPSKTFDEESGKFSPFKVLVRPHSSKVLGSQETAAIIKKMKEGE